jgi:flagellar hook-associated protein 3 FlgL
MRVATRSLQLQFLTTLAQQQQRLARLQQQAATGKKVTTAADNPAAAVQVIALQNSLEQLVGYETNAGIARGRLSLEEQGLTNVVNSLQRIRDLVVDARGPGRTEVELGLIASEVKEILGGILDTANSQDGEGRYLFAGNLVQTLPFTETPGGVTYNGDQGVRSQRISESRVIQEGDSGADVFGHIRAGNGVFTVTHNPANTGGVFFTRASVTDPSAWDAQTYTITFTAPDAYEVRDSLGALVTSGSYSGPQSVAFSGISVSFEGAPAAGDSFTIAPSPLRSVFDSVQELVGALGGAVSTVDGRAEFESRTNSALMNLDRALEHVSEVRSRVGQRLAVIDEQQSSNDRLSIEVSKVLSRAQDADFAAIISELEAQAFALEAAQKSYARIQSRTLFDLL